MLVLNRTYANRNNAERAAKMQWERLQRGLLHFPAARCEGRLISYGNAGEGDGFKQPIDDAEWDHYHPDTYAR